MDELPAAATWPKSVREWTQFFILLFATGWGVYTFVFKETIQPSRRPATLTVTATLEELGRNGDRVLIKAKIHAQNRSDRKVYVPAMWYSVRGVKLAPQSGQLADYVSQVRQTPVSEIVARYSSVGESDVVAVGTILRQTTDYYEPTDETTNEFLFEAPADRYDALEIKTEFFVAKDTRGLEEPQWQAAESGELFPKIVVNSRPYDPLYDPEHREWAAASGAGFNWSVATLSLWPKPPERPLYEAARAGNSGVAK